MSDSPTITGHKRPLPPPQSRTSVLHEISSTNEWFPVDDDLLVSGSRKRHKSSSGSFTESSLTVPSTQPPTGTAIAPIRTANSQGLAPSAKESLFRTINILQYFRSDNTATRTNSVKELDRENDATSKDSQKLVDKQEATKNEEEEAMRLAQLSSLFGNSMEEGSATAVTPPYTTQINQYRAQTEKEDQARSQLLRAGNMVSQSTSFTTSSLASTDDSLFSEADGELGEEDAPKMRKGSDPVLQESGSTPIAEATDSMDNEALLDIAQQHCHNEVIHDRGEICNEACPARTSSTVERNAFSRAAAESYRTQDRHLETSISTDDAMAAKRAMNEAGAKRLLEIKNFQQAQAKPVPRAEIMDYAVQNNSASTKFSAAIDFRNIARNPDSWRPAVTRQPARQPPTLVDAPVTYPEQGEDLQLPKGFETRTKDFQDLIMQHEIYKQRLRDLNVIPTLMECIANAGSTRPFEDREQRELREAKTFVAKILEEKLSGARKRQRMLDIRDNMRNRANKCLPAPAHQVETLYSTLLRPELQELLRNEQDELEEKVQSLAGLRSAQNQKFHSDKISAAKRDAARSKSKQKPGKLRKTRKSTNPEDGTIDLSDTDSVHVKKLKKHDVKRQPQLSYSAMTDAKEARLRAQLQAFQDRETNGTGGPQDADTNADQDDIQSEISEEDDGANYYSGTRVADQELAGSHTQHTDLLNGTDDTEFVVQGKVSSPTQKPDNDLVYRLQEKQRLRDIRSQQGAQSVDLDLMYRSKERAAESILVNGDTSESEVPFDDLDEDESVDSDDDEEHICYRYLVKVCSIGLDELEDGSEECVFRCLKVKEANRKAGTLLEDVIQRYLSKMTNDAEKTYRKNEKLTDGLKEYTLDLGRDHRVTCRIWVEQEEYSVSDELYKNAQVKRACVAEPVYLVMWEETIRPWVEDKQDQDDDATAAEVKEKPVADIVHVQGLRIAPDETMPEEVTPAEVSTLSETQPVEQFSSVTEVDDASVGGTGIDNDDELFGPASPEPASITTAIIRVEDPATSPTADQTQLESQESTGEALRVTTVTATDVSLTTTIAHANRLAKERYMSWWQGRLRGSTNWDYIRSEEQFIEEELKNHGNLTTWEKEEELEVEYLNGTKAWEKLRVWIEKKKPCGPAN